MTNEDAIKWLENLKQDIGSLRHENLWPYAQALDEIMELLKEQEPVEPKKESDDYPGAWWYVCGNCGEVIDWHDMYCRHCGREVKWE